ncbi:MAG TPA: hypothetical protein VMT19_04400 [Thermoanaerobaculaceae bacterium]|nr:hypothetical protein [Thermoanaerobaculaceae bacterium]
MRVSKRLLLWLAAVAAMGAALLWATSGKPPRLPADADHRFDQTESACLQCHTRTGRHPRPADHPLRDDCFSCHRDRLGELHARPGAPTEVPGGWRDDPRLAARAPRKGEGR